MASSRSPHPPAPALVAIGILAAIAACDAPLGVGNAWVDGEWLYEASARAPGGVSCSLTGVALLLEQDGDAFGGSASDGAVACLVDGESVEADFGTRVVSGGRVRDDVVDFVLGAGEIVNGGEVERRSMTGTVTWTLDLGELGPVTLTGTFAAARAAAD